ncbi:hypothetical protein CEY16_09175 [Halalkalibacillus sediminis]|uniref:Uncharacterized protein n=1 Tax=Halalkalibacillus sediminis TaxID=2018042 RepID=A0A2I0QUU3_9BACI|nr:hypothetical protein [Halalkalibacillus sediminis]PKR78078.1 hypothetical protein CEY16_09175 [Halalkalibacillus sediminis]
MKDEDNIIPFPKPTVELTVDEYLELEHYRKKIRQAKNVAEMDYNYNKAKNLIQHAQARRNK